jgi:hypothetical protein
MIAMFSIFPPFFCGTFSAVFSYITLVMVFVMHIFCLSSPQCNGVSLWALFYFLYYFTIFVWIIGGLIFAFIWSNDVNQVL